MAVASFLHGVCGSLQQLCMWACSGSLVNQFKGVTFPELRALQVGNMCRKTARSLVKACESLERISLHSIVNPDKLVISVSRRQPALLSLELHDLPVSGTALNQALTGLTGLSVVKLNAMGRCVDDACLQNIATHCTALTALALEHCDHVTDTGLGYIAAHRATGLLHLRLIRCLRTTLRGVCAIIQGSAKLEGLALNNVQGGDGAIDLATVISICPPLLELEIVAMPVRAIELDALVHRNERLTYLALCDLTGSCDLVKLVPVVQQAPSLRTLCLSTQDHRVFDLTLKLWQRVKPGLSVYNKSVVSPFWARYRIPRFPTA